MPTRTRSALTLALLATAALAAATTAEAQPLARGFDVEILIDGRPVSQYAARGTRYVEALDGKEYAIRLRNPLGVRVAVALSVDGLNTIDARRGTAAGARKWVLGPYETVTISGWQTSGDQARRFYFTTEERSYATRLGRGDDLGIISAVFYRERLPLPVPVTAAPAPPTPAPRRAGDRVEQQDAASAPAAAGRAQAQKAENDYAATGIGREVDHRVERVWLDLESSPIASVNLRYEYRPQLVRLGVLPEAPRQDRLARRERARGFEGYCPVPPR